MLIDNYDELIKNLKTIFDNGYTFRNLTDKEIYEVIKEKKILEDLLLLFSKEVFESTKENEIKARNHMLNTYSDISMLKNYENIDKLIGYLYYEYNVSETTFIKIINVIIGDNNEKLVDELINEGIIKIDSKDIVSLTDLGIKIAVSLNYSIKDLSKETFVNKVKENIKLKGV